MTIDLTTTPGPPTELVETPEFGLSNFGFTVDPGTEEMLRAGEGWCRYAGWDFNGRVWFADDAFYCQVWVYGVPRETMGAETLDALMHTVSQKYGYA